MSKSILVLDENSVIHGLIASALDVEGLTLHHEFNPGLFMERASSLMPDLILIGNSDADPDYEMPRSLKDSMASVPVVLLASSKEALTREHLDQMQVDGVVRKPFEASDLQQQVSKHLDLANLIGSAYEYQQSQSTREEPENPLANLNVIDDEVLGLLHDDTAPVTPSAGGGMDTVTGDEILVDALQPERAFEPIDLVDEDSMEAPVEVMTLESPEGPDDSGYDALETLDGEFPGEPAHEPSPVEDLEEMGAQDVLDEEPVEETLLEPEGFDQELEGPQVVEQPPEVLETIEVELPEDTLDMDAIDEDLSEGDVEMFETELDSEAPAPPSPEDYQESIPLSVRRMMELKPVFTLGQEEESGAAAEGGFAFEPEAGEVEAIQSELDQLDEIEMDVDIIDEEIEYASDEETEHIHAAEVELPEPDDFDLSVAAIAPGEDDEAEEIPELMDEPLPLDEATPEDGGVKQESYGEPIIDPENDLTRQELPLPSTGEEDLEADAAFLDEMSDDDRPPEHVAALADEGGSLGGDDDDEEFFDEEYLGDEEIDEEQLIAIEEGEELPDHPELSAKDEQELDELLAEEEGLSGLDEIEEVDFSAAEDEEDIELDQEEEDLIRASLAADREAAAEEEAAGGVGPEDIEAEEDQVQDLEIDEVAMVDMSTEGEEEPLFERNFNALNEEEPVAGDSEVEEGDVDEDSEWSLEETDSGLAVSDASDEIITLGDPVGEGLSLGQDEELSESLLMEAGEDEEDHETVVEESWKPEVPPSFVPKPTEEFPEDAVKDPFEGVTEEAGEDPSAIPRHKPQEILEDPESLQPVMDQDSISLLGQSDDISDGSEPMVDETVLSETLEAAPEEGDMGAVDEDMTEAFEDLAPEEEGEDELAAMLGAEGHEEAPPEYMTDEVGNEPEEASDDGGEDGDEFDSLFADLQAEIAANPEGERLDDVLRTESIRDGVDRLDFDMPEDENTLTRALGIYAMVGDGEEASVYPKALAGNGTMSSPDVPTAPSSGEVGSSLTEAPVPEAPLVAGLSSDALSLLDPDIRNKLGQVLDEIISISVRKAVQEEMPKIMERLSRED